MQKKASFYFFYGGASDTFDRMSFIKLIEAKPVHPKETSLEKQVFVGPFLGPFLALLTLAIALFYYSPQQMELPLAALAGIYCSWKWQIRGAAIAWVLLAAVTSIKIASSPATSLWWNLSLGLSIALTCLITALTQRNVRDHLDWKYQDSVEQQSRLAIAEARLNTVIQTVQQERAEAQKQIQAVEAELIKKTDAQKEAAEYLEIAKSELIHTINENELLQKGSVEMRRTILNLQEDLENAKNTLSQLTNQEKTIETQQQELNNLRHALDAYQHQIASYKDDLQRARHQQTLIHEMGDLIETLTREKKLLESTLGNLQSELEVLQNKEHAEELLVTEDSPRELRRLEGFYRQLRDQFEEKSRVLSEARRELFQTQEKLNALERENSERELTNSHITQEEHIYHLTKIEDEFKQELEASHQEVKSLYQLVDSLMSKQ